MTLEFQSSIGPGLLQKLKIEEIIFKKIKKSEKYAKLIAGGAPALEFPER